MRVIRYCVGYALYVLTMSALYAGHNVFSGLHTKPRRVPGSVRYVGSIPKRGGLGMNPVFRSRLTRFLLTGILFLSSMYFMLGCTTVPRIWGLWTETYSPGSLYLIFTSDGTLSVYMSEPPCSSSGTYLYSAWSEGGLLSLEMTDNDPPCYFQYQTDLFILSFISANEFAIGKPMMDSDKFCRTEGVDAPCIE